MPDTAQNQNSINNTQFPYPDFSNPQVNTQPQQVSSQNTLVDEESKLVDLRKSLEDLLEQDKQVPIQPQQNIVPQVDDVKPEEILQDMQSEFNSTPPVVPISTPTNFGALESIMPDMKKPRAMNREPKSNNLANLPKSEEKKEENIDSTSSVNVTTTLNSPAPQVQLVDTSSFDTSSNLTIDSLLSESINRNASDLHLSAGYPPIMRVDGELQDLGEKILTPEDVENLVFSVLSDDKKELLEVNREIDFAYTHGGVMNARFRVNAYYSMKNLSAAFRLIPARIRTIEELMLPQIYHQFAKLKQGLILVTGPTGHGKSTTLAAILEDINRSRFSHIVTIEDPIEYVFEGKKALIDQREMNDDTHSWSIALRSALRQDPDVILVGEMRDYETVAAAITLAETGHLVFATLHTNSASQTIDRIVDVFPENQQQQVRAQIANSIQAVVSQRLIPLEQGGRRAVSEIMLNNSAIANLIREGKAFQIDNVIRTSSDVGMMYLEKSLVNLVREGVISVQKAQEYAVHPEEVLRLLKS
jgi:twitching motility protein PilT